MEITGDDYVVRYDEPSHVVTCEGSFRLGGTAEYAPITDLLNQAAADASSTLTIDLNHLEFLNSSGINMFSKFVISIRQKSGLTLVIRGNNAIPWQGKSLVNLKRLLPTLELELA